MSVSPRITPDLHPAAYMPSACGGTLVGEQLSRRWSGSSGVSGEEGCLSEAAMISEVTGGMTPEAAAVSDGRESRLLLTIRDGEYLLLEGVLMKVRTATRVELRTRARFVFGKQYMQPDQARSPLQRVYYFLQQCYAGPVDLRAECWDYLSMAISVLPTDQQRRVRTALDEQKHDEFYPMLRVLRGMIREEETCPQVM